MPELFRTTDETQAELLRLLLEDAGIAATVENTAGARLTLGTPTAAVPLVLAVAEFDLEPARAVLLRAFAERRLRMDAADDALADDVADEDDEDDTAGPRARPAADDDGAEGDSGSSRTLRCACGRELELPPDHDASTLECPWCGRTCAVAPAVPAPPGAVLDAVAAPAAPVVAAAPAPESAAPAARRRVGVMAVVGLGLFAALLVLARGGWPSLSRFGAARSASTQAGADDESADDDVRYSYYRDIRKRALSLPVVVPLSPDADGVCTRLAAEIAAPARRWTEEFARCTSWEEVFAGWLGGLVELDPDTATELGLKDCAVVTGYATADRQQRRFLDAAALRRLRTLGIPGEITEARLLGRMLESRVAAQEFTPEAQHDPTEAFSGLLVTHLLLTVGPVSPAAWEAVVGRLEGVPTVVAEVRDLLETPPRLWVDFALEQGRDCAAWLRRLAEGAPPCPAALQERWRAAVAAATQSLLGYGTFLTDLRPRCGAYRAPGPAYLAWRLGPQEFDARGVAVIIDFEEELDRGMAECNRLEDLGAQSPAEGAAADSPAPARADWERAATWARDTSAAQGWLRPLDGPAPEVEVLTSPLLLWMPAGGYVHRPLARSGRGVWLAPPSSSDAAPPSATRSAGAAHETWPGHHAHALLSRGAHAVRLLYPSARLAEGWGYHCEGLVVPVADGRLEDRRLARAEDRQNSAWFDLFELALIGGTLPEAEALEFLQQGVGYDLAVARRYLASATLNPLANLDYLLGDRAITALREETALRLGERFDAAEFHARLLGAGNTPLPLVRKELEREWR